MKYRTNPKNGDELSALGFGCMRLTKDEKEVEKQVAFAIENGINYFDTAYIYMGNEALLGRVLSKGYRECVKLATKMPHYLIRKREDLDKIFNRELERLQTDYIDYYLMHTLNDTVIWDRLVSLGITDWIEEKKHSGEIVNIGFSYHGGRDEFHRVVDAYDWGFCMIQYNYLDENNQAGKSGLHYAAQKGIPVMVMEPLRGGRLVNGLPKEVLETWSKAYIRRSPAEWGLRYVWNHPEVTTVLSGMNSMRMLEENIRIASNAEANAFTEADYELFRTVGGILKNKIKVPCTGCNYCMPCPSGVDIPLCFSCFNDIEIEGKMQSRVKYIMNTGMKSESVNASKCTKCGKCESRCPQNILIRKELDEVTKAMEGLFYKPARFFIKKMIKF